MQRALQEHCKSHDLDFGVYNRLQRNQGIAADALLEPNIQELVRLWAEHVDQQLRVDVSKLRNALQISMAPVSSGASVIVNPTDQSDEAYLKFLLRQIVVICLHVRKLKQQPALLCSAQKKLSDA